MDPELENNPDDIEIDLDGAADLEVAIVDDTPPEDRNRKPLATDPLSVDDEAAEYSEKIKKRMGELRHKAHDERRAREAAERREAEAVRVARESYHRAKLLERQLTNGEAAFAGETKQKAELQLASARAKYNTAYEAGDADKTSEAIAEIAAAAHAKKQAELWEQNATHKANSALQQDEDAVDFTPSRQQPATQAATPEPEAEEWAKRNPWFGPNEEMTSLVYGVHERLVKSGVHPVNDADEYYAEIDATVRKRFPEYEWGNATPAEKPARNTPATKAKVASVVAPVTRTPSGNKPRKVTLTKSQVAMANMLGVSLQDYARELMKEGD